VKVQIIVSRVESVK